MNIIFKYIQYMNLYTEKSDRKTTQIVVISEQQEQCIKEIFFKSTKEAIKASGLLDILRGKNKNLVEVTKKSLIPTIRVWLNILQTILENISFQKQKLSIHRQTVQKCSNRGQGSQKTTLEATETRVSKSLMFKPTKLPIRPKSKAIQLITEIHDHITLKVIKHIQSTELSPARLNKNQIHGPGISRTERCSEVQKEHPFLGKPLL